jgi:hypothetical protein
MKNTLGKNYATSFVPKGQANLIEVRQLLP